MRAKELLDSISLGLSVWVTNVQYNNCINFYDINRISEGFVCMLLNAVYGYELNNLNEQQKNHCAIDLGDTKKGFSFQITSRTDSAKIKDTLKKFVALVYRYISLDDSVIKKASSRFSYGTILDDIKIILQQKAGDDMYE